MLAIEAVDFAADVIGDGLTVALVVPVAARDRSQARCFGEVRQDLLVVVVGVWLGEPGHDHDGVLVRGVSIVLGDVYL